MKFWFGKTRRLNTDGEHWRHRKSFRKCLFTAETLRTQRKTGGRAKDETKAKLTAQCRRDSGAPPEAALPRDFNRGRWQRPRTDYSRWRSFCCSSHFTILATSCEYSRGQRSKASSVSTRMRLWTPMAATSFFGLQK